MRDDVVALYVDRLGPYPKLVREWYDEARDATTYKASQERQVGHVCYGCEDAVCGKIAAGQTEVRWLETLEE